MLPRIVCLIVLIASSAVSSAQLRKEELRGIQDALMIANMGTADLNAWFKSPRDGGVKLLKDCLEQPLTGLDTLAGIHESARVGKTGQILLRANEILGVNPQTPSVSPSEIPDTVPEPLRPALGKLVAAIIRSNEVIKSALSKLSPEEKRSLIEALPQWASGDPALRFDFAEPRQVRFGRDLSPLLSRVDLVAIRSAAPPVLRAVEDAAAELRLVAAKVILTEPLKFWVEGVPILVAGTGPDLHEEREPMLTIDLGGNDRYVGRHGAGIGYTGVLIDLSGDDTYEVPDANLGTGLLGIGIALDLGGNDEFRCGSLALGVGLGGVGVFVKTLGKDHYSTGHLSCGFGQYGVGLFFESGGDDDFRCGDQAMGSSRTQGVGWFVDRAGSDRYNTSGGGLANSRGYPDEGLGGGVALVTSLGGDDEFTSGSDIATATTGGIACLLDSAGNDLYRCDNLNLASNDSLSFLQDDLGHDIFAPRLQAVASARSSSFAFCLDRDGDDTYLPFDSVPGTATDLAFGICLDDRGQDSYGSVFPRALFSTGWGATIDLNGIDVHGSVLENDEVLTVPDSVRLDTSTAEPAPKDKSDFPQWNSMTMPSFVEMERLWNGNLIANLVGIGDLGLRWLIDHHLASAGSTERNRFSILIQNGGVTATQLLVSRLTSPNADEVRNATSILTIVGAQALIPHLPKLLSQPATQLEAIRATGRLRVTSMAPDLMLLTLNQDRTIAVAATEALADIADAATLSTAEALLRSKDWFVRQAALRCIVKIPGGPEAVGMRFVQSVTESDARIGVILLSYVTSREVLKELSSKLEDPRPGVKIQAILALDGRVPEAQHPVIVRLRRDPNPLVRGVASRISLGR